MAPACILLDRTVVFCDHPLEADPFKGGERAEGVVGATNAALPKPLSPEATEAAVARYLRAMKPDLQFVEPPGVSRLTMARPLSSDPIPRYGRHLTHGSVAAADKNLVLLYAGTYRPTLSYKGWHLLFDAASSSLSTIPGIHRGSTGSYKCAGHGTVIMAREGGAFVLAELLFHLPHSGPPAQGLLCLWQSSSSSEEQNGEWVCKAGQLPDEARHTWRVHMSFPVQSRNLLCWVDLRHGLLLCDVGRHCGCEEEVNSLDMSFVPLPHGFSISAQHPHWSNPQDFRNVACVDGIIKFFAMDPGGPISLVTYALDLDEPSPRWMEDTVMRVDDLWVDKKFIDVPRIRPVFPILSTLEHDVVHLVIPGDLESEEGYLIRRARLQFSVDTRKTRVISMQKHPAELLGLRRRIAFSFNASQWGSKHHQAHNALLESASLSAMENDRLLPVPRKVVRARREHGSWHVFVYWEGNGTSWQPLEQFKTSYPSFELEDELFVEGGRNVMTGIQYQRQRRCKRHHGDEAGTQQGPVHLSVQLLEGC